MNNFLVNSMHGGQIVDHDAHRPREEQSHVHLLLPPPSSNCKMFCVHFCAKPSVPAASAIARNTPPPAEGTWNTLSSTAKTSLSSHSTPPSTAGFRRSKFLVDTLLLKERTRGVLRGDEGRGGEIAERLRRSLRL